MRLLQRNSFGQLSLTENLSGNGIPKYAILSHTWGEDTEEVTFEDIINGHGEDKHGYEKIRFCEEQARQDGLIYFWIDTCCIYKGNKAELSRSINSMFRWYQKAAKCYVYLSDVSTRKRKASDQLPEEDTWEAGFRNSRWFTRGWTLQELLAPASVEFFSRERKRLGNKTSLRQLICEITNIPHSALQGYPLSQFSFQEQLRWIEHRQTKLEEDKAYSLVGIFDVYILPIYGEGVASALARLKDEFDKMQKCIQDLRPTDPRDDKRRIEETKGGLVEESYHWILENSNFQQWRNSLQMRLLWIKGDPGKGKTMLLCGIIDELSKSTFDAALLSYFFCQATDSRINNATAVLRGLIYMLVGQQPSLVSHIQKKHDDAGKALFEDTNAWVALAEVFTKILQDPSLDSTYLIIDALDECEEDLSVLLDFIVRNSALPHVKWIVSSRNVSDIEQRLRSQARLSLEITETAEQVSLAVDAYIKHCVSQLPNLQDDEKLQAKVRDAMRLKANGTFLWVSYVVKELKKAESWEVEQIVDEMPSDLEKVYDRMLKQIQQLEREKPELCRLVLATATTAYRPLSLGELGILSGLPSQISNKPQSVARIVILCGSFLTMREGQVYIIHQSAKEFLSKKLFSPFSPYEVSQAHRNMFLQSLHTLSRTLRRNMYKLNHSGFPIDQVEQPEPDPLAVARYSIVHWVDHLHDCDPTRNAIDDIQNGGSVDKFLRQSYLYWLEALSLCKSMSDGVFSIGKLEALIQKRADTSELLELVQDARRFILYHKYAIENSPLQAYTSALLFSPARSLIRCLFKKEAPKSIAIKPDMEDKWGACLQTLEVRACAVAFSDTTASLASVESSRIVKIWDADTGKCLKTLDFSSDYLAKKVAFSPNLAKFAFTAKSEQGEDTVQIWDMNSDKCLQTLYTNRNHTTLIIFSPNSAQLAVGFNDGTVDIWDINSGELLQTFKAGSSWVRSIAFSYDMALLALAVFKAKILIWDISNSKYLQTFESCSDRIVSVVFAHDAAQIASVSEDGMVDIWDISSGNCIQRIVSHSDLHVCSVVFSHNSAWLASASYQTVKIWDVGSGECLQTLMGHSDKVLSVAFSYNSARLASMSNDHTVKIWDTSSSASPQRLKGNSGYTTSIAISYDSKWLASGSNDGTVIVWDISSGKPLQKIKGHSRWVILVAFSNDTTLLALTFIDGTYIIWDINSSKLLQKIKCYSTLIESAAFSNDLTLLALAPRGKMGTVEIWDVSSGECLQTLKGHRHLVRSVAFSPGSAHLLASASEDKTVKIWDTSSGRYLYTLEGHSEGVISVAFSHNSACFASASKDKTVKIWDAGSRECLQTIRTSQAHESISFSATGLYLFTEMGSISVNASDASLASNITPISRSPRDPQYQGAGLSSDGKWITYNTENRVWLPSEYRPSCSAVSGNTIFIGCGTGKILICKVENDTF
ncbi:hypothetical protein ACMFMG_002959 [Clarireedia jacksonii]